MQTDKNNLCETSDEVLQKRGRACEVSVIVPMYNMEKYLEECIKSIQAQTFNAYELILVDDGSKDASYEIAQKLAEGDPRITVIHKENEGVSVARNTGMNAANGKWVMFVDPDDTIEPSLVQELLDVVNTDVDIAACCCNVIFDNAHQVDYFFSGDRIFSSGEEKKDLYKQLMRLSYGQPGEAFTGIGVPWGKLYRASFLKEYDLRFNSRLRRFQDNIFNMYAVHFARSISYINKPLYNYSAERVTQYKQNYKPGFAEYILALCEERYIFLDKFGLLEDKEINSFFQSEMLLRITKILAEDIISPYNKMTHEEKKEQIKGLREKKCFESLFLGPTSGLSVKDRLKLFLLKTKRYHMLIFLANYRKSL